MTPDQINTAIAELCGWTHPRVHSAAGLMHAPGMHDAALSFPPPYTHSRDACSEFESTITSTADRVKWLNTMREIVSRRCPKNKIGAPLVSDFDIAMSTAMERCECWLKMKGRWE